MTVGWTYAPEWRDYFDPLTGRQVRQLTDSPAEDYHLYFYYPSVTPDGKYLIFFSERTGISNLFRLDLQSGHILQLTDARPVRGEYWPFTGSLQGAGACLAALGSHGQEVFYFGEDQRCHPHPSFTHDGSQVIFTSNRTGASNVYLTDWDGD